MKYYNYEFADATVEKDLHRLTNQIWKLLPMRENQEDWQKQLDSVLIELRGLSNMFDESLNLLILISKLEGLLVSPNTNFMTYRSTVFSVISDITEIANSIHVRKP